MSKVISSKELLLPAKHNWGMRHKRKKSEQGYTLTYISRYWLNAWNILNDNECLHKEEKKEGREEGGHFITKM